MSGSTLAGVTIEGGADGLIIMSAAVGAGALLGGAVLSGIVYLALRFAGDRGRQ